MKIIAVKPNNVKREHLSLEENPQDIPEFISKKIKEDLFLTPKDKYPHPLTSSQEIGWEAPTGLNTHKRRAKQGCDVTAYANEYVKVNGKSPYSNKEVKKEDVEDKK